MICGASGHMHSIIEVGPVRMPLKQVCGIEESSIITPIQDIRSTGELADI